ncbi:MAG TPA: twin-arginine translocase subunit TatC [Candidatus Baltobacteraceae bacterium]|nr:twin-arginine translocase subunit TatC [Candidatus Baltobacteraceae bacterium]
MPRTFSGSRQPDQFRLAKIKRTFPIPPSDLFVFIRVIRGLSYRSAEYLAKPIIKPMALRDIFKFRELPESETTKPFLEHLEDLRWTVVKMAITLVIAMIICFAFRSLLVRVMQAPLQEVGSQIGTLKALGVTDSLVISFHLAFYAGIVLSFPLLLYFLAEFVLPALTAMEKRFVLPAIFASFGLFLLGVIFCYYWLLPKTILFFFRDTESLGWAPTWTVQQYYSFVTRFTIGFGLAFELPVVVLALVRFGLLTYQFMARTRPYAIVLIFILATIITPTPDVMTLIAMGLPMYLLYESCIWIAWFIERRRARSAAG